MKNSLTFRRAQMLTVWLAAVAVFALPLAALAQGTRITAPRNSYPVSTDIQAGREAAQQVERQLPILNDGVAQNYIERIGRRLAASIPGEFQHQGFNYTFRVINARDINAFALPGGPVYVNRGLIEAANSEGELAGVLAHEISHSALRHATAGAPAQQRGQILGALGQILGSVIGGVPGAVIGTAGQVGAAAYVTRYSREFETQADILGAQIMARAGYDPRDLANMFRTIERESGGRGGVEWLSTHPNPGNRYERINQEARLLGVPEGRGGDTGQFASIQSRLRSMGRAPSMEEIARGQQQGRGGQYPQTGGTISGRVEPPSRSYRTHTLGNFMQLSVPGNWRELGGGQQSVTYAPDGAFDSQGQFTHGVMVGVTQSQSNNLQQSSDAFIQGLLQNNPHLRPQSNYQRGSIAGRQALAMTVAGVSNITRRTEVATIYTAQLRNGGLLYIVAVAPQDELRYYQNAFQTVLQSIRLND